MFSNNNVLKLSLSLTGNSSRRFRGRSQVLEHEERDGASTVSPSLQSLPMTSTHTASDSLDSFKTNATSYFASLPALQLKGVDDQCIPLAEEDLDPGSFDLVAPPDSDLQQYSLETRSEQLFSAEHLKAIFDDPRHRVRFTSFLNRNRQSSVPILIYYLDAVKALKALAYSNGIAESLEPIRGFDITRTTCKPSTNPDLEEKAELAFAALAREDLPAFITYTYTQTVSLSIQSRVIGTLPAHLREASEGLAEVFCLSDPLRPDNPIIFASEGYFGLSSYRTLLINV